MRCWRSRFSSFAGELMGAAGIADKLIAWVLALIGRMPGSLGVATVGASTLIGAISGASVATVAAVGKSLYPGLIRDGYGPRFASGLVSSSGAIDILIPPSIAMILYGAAAEQSIPKLFVAGILPGLLIALMMAGFVVILGDPHEHPAFGPCSIWRNSCSPPGVRRRPCSCRSSFWLASIWDSHHRRRRAALRASTR